MKIENILARNYYEQRGDFIGIEESLGTAYKTLGMTEDVLYESLGFERYKDFSPKQVHDLVKDYLVGNKSNLDRKNRDVNTILAEVKKFKHYHAKTYPMKKELELAKYYLMNSNDTSYQGESLGNALELLGMFSKEEFNQANGMEIVREIKGSMPLLLERNIREPLIAGNIIMTPHKLNNNDAQEFYKNLTEILMYNTDVVSKTLRNKCLNNIRGPVSTLKPINEELYKQIMYQAMREGKTINELLELMGLSAVNLAEQYVKYRCLFFRLGKDVILNVFDDEGNITVKISEEGLKSLIATDTLPYMYIQNGTLQNSMDAELTSRVLGGRI